jgi:hypothetical protein
VVRILGGSTDTTLSLPGYVAIAQGGHFFDFDAYSQFGHIQMDDKTVSSQVRGDFGTRIGLGRKMFWTNVAGNGYGVWLNTPNGASQVISNIFMSSPVAQATASGPAIRITGTGDVRIDRVDTTGTGGSFLYNPSAASAASVCLILINECEFDTTNSTGSFDNMLINPGAGCSTPTYISMVNTWIASATGNGLHVTGTSTPIKQVSWGSGQCINNGAWGVLVDNGLGNTVVGVTQPAANQAGVLFSGNVSGATHFA